MTRGLARLRREVVAHLGVDEKAIAKRHRYLTVVADLDRSRVLYLAEDRKQVVFPRGDIRRGPALPHTRWGSMVEGGNLRLA